MMDIKLVEQFVSDDDAITINTNVTNLPSGVGFKTFAIKKSNGAIVQYIKARSQEDVLMSDC
jgi:hypothetical protein